MLHSLPGRERVTVHRLQAPFDQATTWLMWRKGMCGANLSAWIALQEQMTVDPEARHASLTEINREIFTRA